jgi:hypothetical protein
LPRFGETDLLILSEAHRITGRTAVAQVVEGVNYRSNSLELVNQLIMGTYAGRVVLEFGAGAASTPYLGPIYDKPEGMCMRQVPGVALYRQTNTRNVPSRYQYGMNWK